MKGNDKLDLPCRENCNGLKNKGDEIQIEKNPIKAEEYWAHQSQDIDGMLGGFAHLHSPDIQVSKKFLSNLKQKVPFFLFFPNISLK